MKRRIKSKPITLKEVFNCIIENLEFYLSSKDDGHIPYKKIWKDITNVYLDELQYISIKHKNILPYGKCPAYIKKDKLGNWRFYYFEDGCEDFLIFKEYR